MTLTDRITAVLEGAGFRCYTGMPADATHQTGAFFSISEGVGAVVHVAWVDASDSERRAMLDQYETWLRDAGLTVEHRDRYLYVSALRCRCAISGFPDVIPAACPVHGVPCEVCGGVESCMDDCGEMAR